ncbi:rhodanese-like domain-containing protein [Azotobacter beijerinckii]|uniref:Thiosulfate sulfurtransferase n=1 Tax=Azotobacter beijerinckii TaxID=170623 RepID=A0A1I4CPK9_9GAMM|nr:rhodanese-like domain-containing protein [Azotobacter beijerinckii]SFB24666.1 thiosulfate sulfurtransferase [Azotobacter beijerinckii]SFK83188.1 thiosulfate sulfurtransferase [Azotobacter beijerinckii]
MPAAAPAPHATEDSRRPADLSAVFAASPAELLARARSRGVANGLSYAGSLYPPEAWALLQAGAATLVDVRSAEELKFVGRVPDSLHVAWQTGPTLVRNPRFLRELESRGGRDGVLVLLCRSGKRSAAAAAAAAAAGFAQVFNVLEGFEGDLDAHQQRGESGGWRHWGLPWVQD